ncbi:hypothetical protein AN958_10591 [Leucoagaricus sp. SymC.cos]|nr:hypothetical protein AN958_10591 [Leucoagaricus sp. SymC.cos]
MRTHDNAWTGTGSGLKGKGTHRSWPQLPEELVRHITTYYLWNRAAAADVPLTWDARELWHNRILYSNIRDAFDLERTLMSVCPQWGRAIESHLFWQQAVTLIDPTDSLAHLAIVIPPPQDLSRSSLTPLRPYRLSPYRHFRQIISCSCLVCRINQPATTRGLMIARRTISSLLGELMDHIPHITLCREHDHRRLTFCGVCLRETPMYQLSAPAATLYAAVGAGGGGVPGISQPDQAGIVENEDEETFPGIEATCRSCRNEWLWKKASLNSRDQEAIGGIEMTSDDWETRQLVDGFIEMAEGTITDVINLAREKYWLRKFTRLGDMMQQALAAAKFNSSASAAAAYTMGSESGVRGLDELMQLEEGGVKDLALGDWARTRILDGFWISPADIWYHNVVPGKPLDMPAVHPCPWTIDNSHTTDPPQPPHQQHPSPSIAKAEIPPSFVLCEQAFIAHGQQLRLILLPAMKNIVRRIAIECALAEGGAEDPTLKASRMTLEQVLSILREEEGIWFDGYDWVERRRNDEEARRSQRQQQRRGGGEEDARSTTSSGSPRGESDSSTTPSPPPLSDEGDNTGKKKGDSTSSTMDWDTAMATIQNKVLIPVEPVLNPPRILRSIPYVPLTTEHLPQFSLDAVKNIWREACAPLYHCRCRICERAVAAANAPSSPTVPQQQQQQSQYRQPPPHPQSQPISQTQRYQDNSSIVLQQPYQQQQHEVVKSPVQIELREVSEVEFVEEDGGAEIEEIEEEEYDLSEEEEEEEEESESGHVDSRRHLREEEEEEEEEERMSLRIPPAPVLTQTRKRSSDEIEDREDRARSGSPPKRQRKTTTTVEVELVVRQERERVQRKRSSQELDEEDEYDDDYGSEEESSRGRGRGGQGEEEFDCERVERSRRRKKQKKRPRVGDIDVYDDDGGGGGRGKDDVVVGSLSPAVWTDVEVREGGGGDGDDVTSTTSTTTTSLISRSVSREGENRRERSRSVTVSEGDVGLYR